MLGRTLAEQIDLLDGFTRQWEDVDRCAVKEFTMSRHGEELGITGNQKLWQALCERRGWFLPPGVPGKFEVVEPSRLRMVKEPRLVIRLKNDRRPEYAMEREFERTPAVRRPVLDWYQHFVERCTG